jgi:hypothetical protein
VSTRTVMALGVSPGSPSSGSEWRPERDFRFGAEASEIETGRRDRCLGLEQETIFDRRTTNAPGVGLRAFMRRSSGADEGACPPGLRRNHGQPLAPGDARSHTRGRFGRWHRGWPSVAMVGGGRQERRRECCCRRKQQRVGPCRRATSSCREAWKQQRVRSDCGLCGRNRRGASARVAISRRPGG